MNIIIHMNLDANQIRTFANLEQIRQWLHGNLENGMADGVSVFRDVNRWDAEPKFALRYVESVAEDVSDDGSAWEVTWFMEDMEDESFDTDDEAVERFVELVMLDRQGL